MVTFKDPKGTTLEIFSDCTFAPDDKTFAGVMPLKLGHIAYTCSDVQGLVSFYCDARLSRLGLAGRFFAFRAVAATITP